MGLYGRSFTLASYHKHGLMDPAKGKGDAGVYTREGGFLAYYEVWLNLKFALCKDSHALCRDFKSSQGHSISL